MSLFIWYHTTPMINVYVRCRFYRLLSVFKKFEICDKKYNLSLLMKVHEYFESI